MKFLAYLDAGTGSIIIQAIIGALVGIGVILRTFWGRITGFFKRTESPTEETAVSAGKSSKK